MIILIDCDGVLLDFLGHSLTTIDEADYVNSLTPDLMSERYFHQLLPDGDPVTGKVWAKINSTPGWVASMPALEHTQEMLESLRVLGEVVAVTSSADTMPTWGYERTHALYKLGFRRNQIVQTARKDLVWGNVFIDDHPNHIEAWAKRWARSGFGLAVLWLDHRFKRPVVNEPHVATYDRKQLIHWIQTHVAGEY